MGLFSKWKAPKPEPEANNTPAPAPTPAKNTAPVNPDDIWGTPKPRKPKPVNGFADETYQAMNEPVSIDPDTIKKKMADLEHEIEEKKSKPAQAYEPIKQVEDGEVTDAQTKFEEKYRVEHERYVETHQQDIDEARLQQDLEQRISDMIEERDRRAAEREGTYKDIASADDGQMSAMLDALGVAKDETKDAEYQNISSVGSDEIERKLTGLGVAKDESKDKDYKNIKAISAEDAAAKTREFLEVYGDRRRSETPERGDELPVGVHPDDPDDNN
ncbi:MAG: hypothetical protein K6B74_03405 [Ruminococcus sp.]|nr:hypothetical protein [Ruminococcus sp.]